MENITLDMIPNGYAPTAHISQYDSGRHIRFNLLNITLTGAETVRLKITKPDGNNVSKIIENHTSYVEYVSESTDCDVDGTADCEIVVFGNDDVIGSKNFKMNIEADAYDSGSVVVETASGDPAAFNTNIVDNVIELKANINPLQDLHGYDHPWVGGAGTNKWDEVTQLGYWNGTTGIFVPNPNELASINFIPVTPNTTYYFKKPTGQTTGDVIYFDENKEYISYNGGLGNRTFTTPNNCYFIQINLGNNYGNTYNHDVSINSPSTVTTYSPYENICPIVGHSELNLVRTSENLFTTMPTTTNDGITTSYDSSTGYISITNDSRTANYGSGSMRGTVATGLNSAHTYRYVVMPNVTGVVLCDENSAVLNNEFTGITTAKLKITNQYDFVNDHPIGDTTRVKLLIVDITEGSYTPYLVSFGQTVYGGEYDANRGKVTITHVMIDMGDMYWSYNSNYGFISTSIRTTIKGVPYTEIANVKCDIFKSVKYDDVTQRREDYAIGVSPTEYGFVVIADSDYTSEYDFNQYIRGHKLVYELATPIEIDVSALSVDTLMGNNNIFHDANGPVEVKYWDRA